MAAAAPQSYCLTFVFPLVVDCQVQQRQQVVIVQQDRVRRPLKGHVDVCETEPKPAGDEEKGLTLLDLNDRDQLWTAGQVLFTLSLHCQYYIIYRIIIPQSPECSAGNKLYQSQPDMN